MTCIGNIINCNCILFWYFVHDMEKNWINYMIEDKTAVIHFNWSTLWEWGGVFGREGLWMKCCPLFIWNVQGALHSCEHRKKTGFLISAVFCFTTCLLLSAISRGMASPSFTIGYRRSRLYSGRANVGSWRGATNDWLGTYKIKWDHFVWNDINHSLLL